jgi:hypothetical protein
MTEACIVFGENPGYAVGPTLEQDRLELPLLLAWRRHSTVAFYRSTAAG